MLEARTKFIKKIKDKKTKKKKYIHDGLFVFLSCHDGKVNNKQCIFTSERIINDKSLNGAIEINEIINYCCGLGNLGKSLKFPRFIIIDSCRGNEILHSQEDKGSDASKCKNYKPRINEKENIKVIWSNTSDTKSFWLNDQSGSHLISAFDEIFNDRDNIHRLELSDKLIKLLRKKVEKTSRSQLVDCSRDTMKIDCVYLTIGDSYIV